MRHLLILVCLYISNIVLSQEDNTSKHTSKFLVPEGNLGLVSRVNEKAQLIGGFGIWNYLSIDNFHGKRNSAIGLSIPLRLGIVSQDSDDELEYNYSLSIAPMFRFLVQQHPVKETFWFFMGVGPEFKTGLESDVEENSILIQQEFGFKIYNPDAILPDNELGFSVSWPASKIDWAEKQRFLLFFARLAIY